MLLDIALATLRLSTSKKERDVPKENHFPPKFNSRKISFHY